MSISLFMSPPAVPDLDPFANSFCAMLNIAEYTTRHSSFYVNERDRLIRVLGLEMNISITDDYDFPGYAYKVNIDSDPNVEPAFGMDFLRSLGIFLRERPCSTGTVLLP